jgi:hypothetical protein
MSGHQETVNPLPVLHAPFRQRIPSSFFRAFRSCFYVWLIRKGLRTSATVSGVISSCFFSWKTKSVEYQRLRYRVDSHVEELQPITSLLNWLQQFYRPGVAVSTPSVFFGIISISIRVCLIELDP